MNSQKIENSLSLALAATPDQLKASPSLQTGYDFAAKTWELIVKYNQLPDFLSYVQSRKITTELLLSGYAILTLPEAEIDALTRQPFITYIEQPKRLFFADIEGVNASCIPPNRQFTNHFTTNLHTTTTLTGEGVLIGLVDSGIDFTNPDFLNADGTTRILALYDLQQNLVFSQAQINTYLKESTAGSPLSPDLEALSMAKDFSGHGTAVAGIAAANGALSMGQLLGVAPKASLLVVKLGPNLPDSFPRTTQLMKAVNWLVLRALQYGQPISINISIGNTYGSHDGTSLLETFLDAAAEVGRCVICVGSGNEGASAGHTTLFFSEFDDTAKSVSLQVGRYETGLTLQLWKNYAATCEVVLYSPDGTRYEITQPGTNASPVLIRPSTRIERSLILQTAREYLLVYIGSPAPYSVNQEIYFDFIPKEAYLSPGIWRIEIIKTSPLGLSVDFYLPPLVTRSEETRFPDANPNATLTIPSTASRVITVGAYDTHTDLMAPFSGVGYLLRNLSSTGETAKEATLSGFFSYAKPDLVAPGVEIISNNLYQGYDAYTGTSFATPFVTGACALLMEWGIIQGNDPFLYGEKVKATLHRLARPLQRSSSTPNSLTGYGALCLNSSKKAF